MRRSRPWFWCSLTVWALLFAAGSAAAPGPQGHRTTLSIAAAADGIVRDGVDFGPQDGNPDQIIDGGTIQVVNSPGQEDRGVVEFPLDGLRPPIFSAVLVLPTFFPTGPYPFNVDVYAYDGDGALTIADWGPGSLIESLVYAGEPVVELDVTAVVRKAVAHRASFAGFNFRFPVQSPIVYNGPCVSFGTADVPPASILRITTLQHHGPDAEAAGDEVLGD